MSEEEEKPADAGAEEKSPEDDKAGEDDALLNKTEDPLHRVIDDAELCCCCICHCQTPETRDLSCFGCFPIKCAIIGIGILTIFLVLLTFCEIFWLLLNDYVKWWYVLVAVILMVPAFIGCCFLIVFFNADQSSTRAKVFVACMFVIISFSLVALWNMVYFNFWYKDTDDVKFGSEQTGYYNLTKKQYIFWSLFCACVVDGFYAYFICITKRYYNRLRPKEDEKKEEPAEDKPEEKPAEDKPAEGGEEKPAEPAEGGD